MSSSFSLLRLPRLVLCEIFKSLNIEEKINLFLCSWKISTQINNARLYSQKVIVDLDCLCHNIRVCSENYRDSFEISIYPDFWKRHNSNTQQFSIECRGFLSVIEHLFNANFQLLLVTMIVIYIDQQFQCCLIWNSRSSLLNLMNQKIESYCGTRYLKNLN
ncbi:hypothetical protein CRE_13782 [Caenorhabditis remanei]|uniref:F-box domain-containing protein n=1 Tax=Caenorhabditis remanei TaxID=31234 RepID=E3NK87_CAERE|nr:hypothetical protein CRE_13782 [Caenorhabditis remanei]